MPYDVSQPVPIKVEFQINGVWIDVTTRGRAAGDVHIKHGQSDGAIQPETSTCGLTIGNDDGWLTEDDPRSPWYPYIGRGTPLRVSLRGLGPAGVDAYQFTGEIDEMVAVYPGGSSSSMEIDAIGTWGTLAQGDDPLRSALYRAITTSSPTPIAYWSFEDGIKASSAASSIPGGLPFMGSIAFEAAQGPDGSDTVASLRDRGTSSGAVLGCGTATWRVEHAALWREADEHSPSMSIEIGTTGSIYLIRFTVDDSPANVIRLTYFVTGGGVGTSVDSTAVAFDGQWKYIRLDAVQDGSDVDFRLTVNGVVALTTTVASQTMGAVVRCGMATFEDTADADIPLIGHIPVWSGTMPTTDTAWASTGYSGEPVTDRIGRLGDEEDLSITIMGDSRQRMGPQRPARLTELFADCQAVDQGLWSDNRADIGLIYRTQSHLYTQAAQVAITVGALTPDTRPRWDYQRIRNEWTVSREGGSSATQSDEDHIARIRRRIRGSVTLRIAGDDYLDQHARWRANLGAAPGPRYDIFGIDLRNTDGARLAAAVLGVDVGDRLTAADAAFPGQHPPGGADQMILGWAAEIDGDFWELRPELVPYRPFLLVGRWASLAHELRTSINTTTTSIDIVNTSTSQPMLGTDPALLGSGYGVTIGGESMRLQTVVDSLITFGSVATASTGSSGSRTPGLPGSSAAGNLIVIFASTRNFGTGVPDTPANWARWPIFPSSANCQVFARVWDGAWSMPTVTFTGGAANEDTVAQSFRLPGKWHDPAKIVIGSAHSLNASAQDITYPGLSTPKDDNSIILFFGWKQGGWTSTTTPGTKIQEASSTAGNDAAQVCAYAIQTTPASIPSGAIAVSGGGTAISRGVVCAVRCDYQTATVIRGSNPSTHAAGDDVTLTDLMRWGLV